MLFTDRIKRNPRNSQELMLKRLSKLHPDEPQKTIEAILEKIQKLETEMKR